MQPLRPGHSKNNVTGPSWDQWCTGHACGPKWTHLLPLSPGETSNPITITLSNHFHKRKGSYSKMLLSRCHYPLLWIRPIIWLFFLHEMAVLISQSSQHNWWYLVLAETHCVTLQGNVVYWLLEWYCSCINLYLQVSFGEMIGCDNVDVSASSSYWYTYTYYTCAIVTIVSQSKR